MLDIQSLSVSYRERPALREITLSVRAGEVLALIGPNGAGKSTLIRAASGILPCRSGKVCLNQREISTLTASERARMLAVVPQTHQLPPTFSVYQTVLMGRTPYLGWLGNPGRSDHALVAESLDQAGIAEMSARLMGELSGGEQQKVLLARALAQSTPILLLDEPTNHLDLRHQANFLSLVRKLAVEKGLAVLVALHDLNLASLFADRVALLSHGHLQALGAPEQVFTEAILTPVYGVGLRVMTHPEYGTPLVLPDGPSADFAPHGRGYLLASTGQPGVRLNV